MHFLLKEVRTVTRIGKDMGNESQVLITTCCFQYVVCKRIRSGNCGWHRAPWWDCGDPRSDYVKLWWSIAQVGFNSRYLLYCQWLYLPFFFNLRVSRNWKSKMTIWWRYQFCNLWKICNIIGPNTYDIGSFQKLWVKVLTTNQFVYLIS